ncbi:MAG: hypothetical protein EOO53_14325 [Gammaproteobacteria bacterium]|nr:MAG: hypothetical protein EOO53_14325 [Gammaproteobacteria bacterium]
MKKSGNILSKLDFNTILNGVTKRIERSCIEHYSVGCLLLGNRHRAKIIGELLYRRMSIHTIDVIASPNASPKQLALSMLHALGIRDAAIKTESQINDQLFSCLKERAIKLIVINESDNLFGLSHSAGSAAANRWLNNLFNLGGMAICLIGATVLHGHLDEQITKRITDGYFI